MGGATLPTASTPGYGRLVIGGRTFVACDCLRTWIPAVEALGLALGLIHESLDGIQCTGLAAKSAGVHAEGGAADLVQRSDAWISLYRHAGAAAWRRDADPDDGNVWPVDEEHTHLVLIGCEHNGPARYQVDAYRDGYDGLGYQGRAHPDPHRRPAVIPTWTQGLAWVRSELARLTQEDNPMPHLTDAQQETVLDAAQRTLGRDPQRYMLWTGTRWKNVPAGTQGARPAPSLDSLDGQTLREDMGRLEDRLSARLSALTAALGALQAGGPGVTVDQVLEAAKAGAEEALDERILATTITLEAAPPASS